MKKIFFLLLTFLLVSSSYAKDRGIYLGVKGGIAYIDVLDLDDGTLAAAYGGYQINRFMSSELEVGKFEAENDYYWKDELEGNYFAGYFVGTIGNDIIYGKAKVGLLYEDIEIKRGRWSKSSATDIGLSVGVGGGLLIGEVFELNAELVVIEQDVAAANVGLKIRL